MLTYDRGTWANKDIDKNLVVNIHTLKRGWEDVLLGVGDVNCVIIYNTTQFEVEDRGEYSSIGAIRGEYEFIVVGETVNYIYPILVTDYPSLLMLIKEMQPALQLAIETYKLESSETNEQDQGEE